MFCLFRKGTQNAVYGFYLLLLLLFYFCLQGLRIRILNSGNSYLCIIHTLIRETPLTYGNQRHVCARARVRLKTA
jgi:hypothetical protein